MRENKSKKLSKEEFEKLEDYAAERLADILVQQLDYEKMKKDKNQNGFKREN